MAVTDVAVAEELPSVVVTVAAAQERKAHPWRATGQLGTLLLLDLGWYEWQIELNKKDFDFDRSFSEQWRRLTTSQGHRLDNNAEYLNVGHSFFGGVYYQLARTNGLSFAESALANLIASTIWETAVEHREVLSINDHITTVVAGVPIGEALYQVAEVFARSKPTFGNRLAMGLVSPFRALAWAFGDAPRPSGQYGNLGVDRSVYHRFALSVGAVRSTGLGWSKALRADLDVVNLPDYGRPASGNRMLHGGEFTNVLVDYSGYGDDSDRLVLGMRTNLWGSYHEARTDDASAGSSRFLGAASAFELAYDDYGDLNDFLMFVHAFGPSIDLAQSSGKLFFRAGLDLYLDFSLARPFSLPGTVDPALTAGAKTILDEEGYYYGWGATAAIRTELEVAKVRAGLSFEWNGIDSIEGLDRYQNAFVSPTGVPHAAISDDSNLTELRLQLRAFAEVPMPWTAWRLGLAAELKRRSGTWKDLARTDDTLRLGLHASYPL